MTGWVRSQSREQILLSRALSISETFEHEDFIAIERAGLWGRGGPYHRMQASMMLMEEEWWERG